jgi:hypothetical protein
LIPGVHFGNAIQQVEAPGLAGNVGVVIGFGQDGAGVVVTIFGGNFLKLGEEMIQLSSL